MIVYAGKAQSSCQGLYKLNEKFTVNAESDVFDSLPAAEQDCADRIWPHRSSLNRGLGKGPVLEGMVNGRGGHEIEEGLWLYDYNMQSEYTEVSTFIHEFGHSLGTARYLCPGHQQFQRLLGSHVINRIPRATGTQRLVANGTGLAEPLHCAPTGFWRR